MCNTDGFLEHGFLEHSPNGQLQEGQARQFISAQDYHEEIRRTIDELYARLPGYHDRTSSTTYTLVRENLEVLSTCYATNILSVTALEVLHAHLLTLRHMFSQSA